MRRFLLALALVALLVQLAVGVRGGVGVVRADEGTFLAMLESLVHDFDLRFEEADADRLGRVEPEGRSHVILQRTDRGVFYSKPILFPLLAAGFYGLLGVPGVVVFNVLVLLAGAFLALHVLGHERHSRWALVGLLGASPVLVYVDWTMTECLQVALGLGGLALSLSGFRGRDLGLRGVVAGGVLLGLLVSLRISNGTVAVIPVLAALARREWRRAAIVGGAAGAAWLAVVVFAVALTGEPNPYRAQRTSFTAETGYPVGADAAEAEVRFVENRATHWTGLRPRADRSRVLYSALYFFVGRHSGVLVYFPALWILLYFAARRGDRVTLAILAGVGASAVFLVGWMPGNWFGGESFVGNRYVLPAWPALLFAPSRLPRSRVWIPAWVLVLVVAVSSAIGLHRAEGTTFPGQKHALGGVFRQLPYESTAQGIEGRRDRYWTGHFLRFVDPFVETDRWLFRLDADAPAPAEFLQAQWREPGELEVEVVGGAPGATLVVEDFRDEHRFELGGGPAPERFRFRPADPWRRHSFWWDPGTKYHVRSLRIRLEAAPGGSVDVRWLGDPAARDETFGVELVELEAPPRVDPGQPVPVRVVVQNASRRIWEPDDVTPVRLRWWWEGEDRDTSSGVPVPHKMAPGETGEWTLEVEPPVGHGRGVRKLHLDLVLERIAWFEDRRGERLADVPVRFGPAAATPPGNAAP